MKIQRIRQILIIGATVFIFSSVGAFAQKAERKNIREGNSLYSEEKYLEAEIAYRKGLEVNSRSKEGTYNLGNTMYRQQKYKEAVEQYQLVAGQAEQLLIDNPGNAARVAQIFHNMGNVGMETKEYAQSVEAYKNALRLNPRDDETRYNLALAQKLLQDQQNQEQSQDDQNQENKEEQQQQQQPESEKENKTQEQPMSDEQMSRDNAQQILDAFLQDEKDTQEKVKQAQRQQQQRRRTEKEW